MERSSKRPRSGSQQPYGSDDGAATSEPYEERSNEIYNSPAAEYNQRVLNKIRKALDKQPDVDLTTMIPSTYSKMLQSRLKVEKEVPALGAQENDFSAGEPAAELLHSKGLKLPTDGIEIIQALSSTSQALLWIAGNEIKDGD